jgi:hypothetical protein
MVRVGCELKCSSGNSTAMPALHKINHTSDNSVEDPCTSGIKGQKIIKKSHKRRVIL